MQEATADLIQVATRVDEDTLKRLDAICKEQKRSRSFVLLEALEQWLDREPSSSSKAVAA